MPTIFHGLEKYQLTDSFKQPCEGDAIIILTVEINSYWGFKQFHHSHADSKYPRRNLNPDTPSYYIYHTAFYN